MFTNQILTYLVWPAFIVISWFIIRAVVDLFEKKFPDGETEA